MADQRGYRGADLEGPQAAAPHTPVLLRTTVELLNVRPGNRFVDATLGTGGHAEAILRLCTPGGSILGIDADPKALDIARRRLSPYSEAIILVNDNFRHLEAICQAHDFCPADGILLDLGLSSLQLDDRDRGFSFRFDAPLDMRFGPEEPTTAAKILNSFSEQDIAAILWDYGEERHSRQIARRIVAIRPIETTMQLVDAIQDLPGMTSGRIHPATRTFQALRIAVNREMESLKEVLRQSLRVLAKGGRLAVISYHSLEDRSVKQFMQMESKACLCPPEVPVCSCGHTPTLRLVNRKAVTPSEEEKRDNPRSRSAKLRVAERL